MRKKIIAIGVVAILALCVVPISFGESDAAITERTVNTLYTADITYDKKYDYISGMLFLDDSANHKVMQDYIKDPLHAKVPVYDDRDEISQSAPVGKTIHTYSTSSYIYYRTYIGGTYEYDSLNATKVLEKSTISFFVKEGDTFKIEILDADSYNENNRPGVSLYYGLMSKTLYKGEDYIGKYLTNTVVYIQPEYNDLATDVTYEASGFSTPNGSSMVFIAAAIVISISILMIVILAGLHPRWEN